MGLVLTLLCGREYRLISHYHYPGLGRDTCHHVIYNYVLWADRHVPGERSGISILPSTTLATQRLILLTVNEVYPPTRLDQKVVEQPERC